jgi:hypothetical protein
MSPLLSLVQFRVPVPPLLHRIPFGKGSPASLLLCSTPTSQHPRFARLRFARRFRLPTKMSGSPRFLGNPCVRATLSDPGGVSAPDLRALPRSRCFDVAFRAYDDVGLRENDPFRGSITRLTHPLSTLRSHGYPCTSLRPRKTRFRLVVNLVRLGLAPSGCYVRFQFCSPTSRPPHPSFAWRTIGRIL